MRERRKKGKGGQRFKSERRKKRRKKRRRRWQRQTLEHENGLCHPFSSAELGDKGSVSASRFFQHLLDDNSYLSPHQRKEREESAEHTVLHVCFSCLFLLIHFLSPASLLSLFSPLPPSLPSFPNTFLSPAHRHANPQTPFPLDPKPLQLSPSPVYLRLEVKGHAWVLMVHGDRQSRLTRTHTGRAVVCHPSGKLGNKPPLSLGDIVSYVAGCTNGRSKPWLSLRSVVIHLSPVRFVFIANKLHKDTLVPRALFPDRHVYWIAQLLSFSEDQSASASKLSINLKYVV